MKYVKLIQHKKELAGEAVKAKKKHDEVLFRELEKAKTKYIYYRDYCLTYIFH